MRKIAGLVVLLSFVVTAISPTLGQKGRVIEKRRVEDGQKDVGVTKRPSVPRGRAKAAKSKFKTVETLTEGKGVWLRWKMDQEVANVGFRVFRVSGSTAVPVSNYLPGSLFTYGEQPVSETTYSFFDPNGTKRSAYYVEAIDTAGETVQTNKSFPRVVSSIENLDGGADLRIATTSVKPGENLIENDLVVSPELEAEIQSGAIQPDANMHQQVISQPGVRITSKADGLVRVDSSQLAAAGFDMNSEPTNWQLYMDGVELPMIVGPNASFIEFIGYGIDTLESDIRTYYLIEGAGPGRRIISQTVRPPLTSLFSSRYSQTFVRKDRKSYTNQILNGPNENWFGELCVQNLSNTPANINFSLSGVDRTPGTRKLKIDFQGFSFTVHTVEVTLNGQVVGTASGSQGRLPFGAEFDVPVDWLLDGNNVLGIRPYGGVIGGTIDTVYLDRFSIDFGRDFIAKGASQVETFNASGTATSAGTVTLQLTSLHLPGGFENVSVQLAGNETNAIQGGLYRSALAANPAINARYQISGAGTTIVLTDRLKAADDPTLNLGIIDAGGTGINPVSNSANTTRGQENRLEFYTENQRNARVSGFASPNFRVFDLTYDNEPRLLTNYQVVQTNGTWGPVMPAGREKVLYAVDEGLYDVPLSVTPNNPELLSDPGQAATFILISHPSLIDQAEAWAVYRSGQGISTKVVDVTDIYDEFNYGVLSSQSIEDFLNYAKNNWQTPPSYVMLFGDSFFDSRNYAGFGYWNMVPTRLVDTLYTETGSDEALSDFNNDGLAEIPIGRAASRDAAGVTALLNKTIAWESALTANSLNRGALFAYDLPVGYDFQAMSDRVMSNLPASMPKITVSRGSATGQADIIAAVNEPDGGTTQSPGPNAGQFIMNYTGHGTASAWENAGFFSSSQAPVLTNANYPTVMVSLTCLNAYFMGLGETFAEAMTKASNGGAVAVWASTGLTTPDVQEILGARFYLKVGEGNIVRMGDLIADAKAQVPAGADVRLSWALIGDPMLKVR